MSSIYKIGSFNVRNLSEKSSHNINSIATIIENERLDVVALQEVLNETSLTRLINRLGKGWAGKQATPTSLVIDKDPNFGNLVEYSFGKNLNFPIVRPDYTNRLDGLELKADTNTYKEKKNAAKGFAFIWNTSRLRECSKKREPLLLDFLVPKAKLARTPLYGRFSPMGTWGGAFFEIRLINIHLIWGGNLLTDKEKRLMEFDFIADRVYTYLSKHRYGNNMPSYTVILGDYNMTSFYLSAKHFDREHIQLSTVQIDPSTLSDDRYVNDYDHFSYDSWRFFDSGVISSERKIDSVNLYCNGSFPTHKSNISDHVPIVLDIDINPIKKRHLKYKI
jgi:endonuclease/exonuclease/phosphatase family metal-dependent hydrolase